MCIDSPLLSRCLSTLIILWCDCDAVTGETSSLSMQGVSCTSSFYLPTDCEVSSTPTPIPTLALPLSLLHRRFLPRFPPSTLSLLQLAGAVITRARSRSTYGESRDLHL